MKILALDLGTKTGWALDETGIITSGVQVFDVKRGESPGMRYVRLMRWLEEIAEKVEIIVYELAHQRGGPATEIAAGFATHVQAFCALKKIEHAAVHTATLKKFVTGSGRADKDAMKLAVVKRGWVNFNVPGGMSDDEADAIGLLYYAREEIVGR